MFWNLFSRKTHTNQKPQPGENKGVQTLGDYKIVRSTPEGRFTVLVYKDTWELLTTDGGLTLDDLRALPERVYATCAGLGLARQEPRQFFLEFSASGGVHLVGGPMCIARTVSSEIKRSILVFPDSYREELALRDTAEGPNPQARRLYTRIALSHEMAHLFATDEFHGPFNGMGYSRLERLTDSITFRAFESELPQAPTAERVAFVSCFPYIIQGVRYLAPQIAGEEFVKGAQFIAQHMISEGQNFKGPARPSEAGIRFGAPSEEEEYSPAQV